MKRLLVFTENYARGGGNLYLTDFVAAVERHFDRVIIASNDGGLFHEDKARLPEKAELKEVGVQTRASLFRSIRDRRLRLSVLPFYFLLWPLLFIWNVWILSRLLNSVTPNIVICCNGGYPGGRSVLLFAWLAAKRGIPVLMTVVSAPLPRRNPLDTIIDFFCRASVTCLVGNAHAVVDGLCTLRGMPKSRTSVVHNCLPDLVCERPKKRSNVMIGCVARMDFSKGARELLDAFESLSLRFPVVRLMLVGAGDASSWLETEVKRRALADKVCACGYQSADAVAALWREMDIFVLPSWHEGLPYSLLEAMRAALPIVATDVGGVPEVVKNEETGLLVEPRSTAALEQALARLIETPELRTRMGTNGRARYLERFGPHSMKKSVDDLFLRMQWISTGNESGESEP